MLNLDVYWFGLYSAADVCRAASPFAIGADPRGSFLSVLPAECRGGDLGDC